MNESVLKQKRSGNRLIYPGLFLTGSAYTLCFAPFTSFYNGLAWIIIPLISIFFLAILSSKSLFQSFLRGYVFGLGLYGSGVSWVYVAIHDYAYTPWWLAAIFTLLFIMLMALFFAAQAILSFYLLQKIRVYLIKLFIVLPFVWILFEWLKTWLFSGFPWLLAGYSQTDTLMINFAPWFGIFGISYILTVNAACLTMILSSTFQQFKTILWIPVFCLVTATLIEKKEFTRYNGDPLSVVIIQGNISQHQRWKSGFIQQIVGTYIQLSRPYWNSTDLIVWPENAIPAFYHLLKESVFADIEEIVKKNNNSFVTGIPVQNLLNHQYYNALLKIDQNGEDYYYKQHLVPFGEYLPLEDYLRGLIRFFDIPMSSFSFPDQQQGAIMIKRHRVAISLCFEDAFPTLTLPQIKHADYALNLSNNGWYGDSLAPHQHLQIARMRAAEAGKELIRSTTSGISAIIDSRGRIKTQSKQFVTTVLEGQIQPKSGNTPYTNYGLLLPLFVSLMFSLIILFKTRLLFDDNK